MESPKESYKELFSALVKAQSEMQIAELSKENPYFKSKYADFTELVRATRPCLTKYGLSVIQPIITIGETTFLRTMLCHSSGEYISSEVKINPAKSDVQSLGSYITYVRRYAYVSIVGACTGDDDDGEKATAPTRQDKPADLSTSSTKQGYIILPKKPY